MVSLSFLNIDFVRVLEIASEIGRVTLVFSFRPPPPEYTFRGLEPAYKKCIEHFQQRCEKKFGEISSIDDKAGDDGVERGEGEAERRFDELERLLERHSRLLQNLNTVLRNPRLHLRRHDDVPSITDPAGLDEVLGPERYISQPYTGYGFSNDYIRQWLAAIPGRFGRHFEAEEAGSINLTRIFQGMVIAVAAGASLLVPMIVMTFKTGRTARLIVVCVATVLFGIAFAIVSTSKENILAGTAAYAAVMVVYIGSASPGFEHS